MSLGSRLTLVVTCLTLVPGPCRAQNDCFTSSSIVGAVLGTFFSTAVALALLVFFLWWIYYRRTPNGTFQFFLPNNRGAILVSSFSQKNQIRSVYCQQLHWCLSCTLYSMRQCFLEIPQTCTAFSSWSLDYVIDKRMNENIPALDTPFSILTQKQKQKNNNSIKNKNK